MKRASGWRADAASDGGPGRAGCAGRCWPAAALFALGLLAFAFLWFTVDLPEDPPELQSAVLVAEDGQELAVLSQEGQRFIVPLDEVNPVVVDALLSAEDRRFYEHGGLDPIGIGRARRQQPAAARAPRAAPRSPSSS